MTIQRHYVIHNNIPAKQQHATAGFYYFGRHTVHLESKCLSNGVRTSRYRALTPALTHVRAGVLQTGISNIAGPRSFRHRGNIGDILPV